MKKINLMIGLLSIGLMITGCSNKKDVVIENSKKTTDKSVNNDKSNNKSNEKNNALSYVNVVESNVNGTSIALKSVHFDFDKFSISNSMRAIAKDNSKNISTVIVDNSSLKIKLEGNCDEWGTDEYNYALGLKRAKSIKDSLVNDGISADSIVLVSFGESNPICTTKNNVCWKKNRRVDYKLLP